MEDDAVDGEHAGAAGALDEQAAVVEADLGEQRVVDRGGGVAVFEVGDLGAVEADDEQA